MEYRVDHADGKIEYYDSAERVLGIHRECGPAIIFPSGDMWYVQRGNLHRTDGPAIVRADGTSEFWVDGVKVKCLPVVVRNNKSK